MPLIAAADERILNFHSDILVFESGWIEVTETITVRAEGNRISFDDNVSVVEADGS